MKSSRYKVAKAYAGLASKAAAKSRKAKSVPSRPLSKRAKAAKKIKPKTVRIGGKGQPIEFKEGTLHAQLGVPEDEPIPARKKAAALAGRYGPLAKKRAIFAFKGALAEGRKKAK